MTLDRSHPSKSSPNGRCRCTRITLWVAAGRIRVVSCDRRSLSERTLCNLFGHVGEFHALAARLGGCTASQSVLRHDTRIVSSFPVPSCERRASKHTRLILLAVRDSDDARRDRFPRRRACTSASSGKRPETARGRRARFRLVSHPVHRNRVRRRPDPAQSEQDGSPHQQRHRRLPSPPVGVSERPWAAPRSRLFHARQLPVGILVLRKRLSK